VNDIGELHGVLAPDTCLSLNARHQRSLKARQFLLKGPGLPLDEKANQAPRKQGLVKEELLFGSFSNYELELQIEPWHIVTAQCSFV